MRRVIRRFRLRDCAPAGAAVLHHRHDELAMSDVIEVLARWRSDATGQPLARLLGDLAWAVRDPGPDPDPTDPAARGAGAVRRP